MDEKEESAKEREWEERCLACCSLFMSLGWFIQSRGVLGGIDVLSLRCWGCGVDLLRETLGSTTL